MPAGLDHELSHIADRVALLVRVVQALRDENLMLRSELDRSTAEARRLHDRLDQARLRVEALIEHLPAAS